MIVLYILILLLVLFGLKFRIAGSFNDYLSKQQCDAIKGVFILLVFIRHIYQYIQDSACDLTSTLDQMGLYINKASGQLLVVMFLFYSGYGVMASIRSKGEAYIKTMPRKRLLTTLLNFDVAVLSFVLLDLILGIEVTVPQVLLSLLGWSSVGNSNWYIFGIILCYAIVYMSFTYFKCRNFITISLASFLVALLVLLLSFLKESWWYNTLLCFPLGLWYAAYQEKIEQCMRAYYWAFLPVIVVSFLLSYHFLSRGIFYNVVSIFFALAIVMLTMKIQIGNPMLNWLGKHLFPLYIYQRLPMIALYAIGNGQFVCNHSNAYILICLVMTILITFFYRYWEIRLSNG